MSGDAQDVEDQVAQAKPNTYVYWRKNKPESKNPWTHEFLKKIVSPTLREADKEFQKMFGYSPIGGDTIVMLLVHDK